MEAFAALADPTRRAIVESLAGHELSVNELRERFAISQPAVSQHLRVLKEAGLVRVRPVAQRRFYSLDPAGFRVIHLWVERQRRAFATQLDALDTYLDEVRTNPMFDDLGQLSECYTITFDRQSRHSAERLWRAITDPGEIAKWMNFPARVDLQPGGEYTVDFGEQGILDGVVIEVVPGKTLKYTWGLSVVLWTIEATSDGCHYRFVHTGLADRGDDEEGLPAGWHEFIDRLEPHLEGRYLSEPEQKARWEQLKPAYRQMLDGIFSARRGTLSSTS